MRDALARAVGDPSLELALWLPERGAYVGGAAGLSAARSRAPRSTITLIGHGGLLRSPR